MEQPNGNDGSVTESPFRAAASFGTALNLEELPGWCIQFIHDGEHTYVIRTDGERVVCRLGGDA